MSRKDELLDGVMDVLKDNPNIPHEEETETVPETHAEENYNVPPVQTEAYQPSPAEYQTPPPVRQQKDNPNHKKKRKKKKKHSRLPGILILTTLIFGASVLLSMVIIGYGKDMFGIGKSNKTHLIVIPEGATTEEIANMLESDGIIKSHEFFTLFTRLRKTEDVYIAGEHFIRPDMAYETIIEKLTNIEEDGEGETVEITFPEGITLIDAAKKLEDENICSYEDFLFYFNSGGFGYEFEDKLPTDTSLKFQRMEGYLFPDTYFFTTNMAPEQVCQKIYMNFNEKMTDDRYARMEELGVDLDYVITLASIVQKEAATTNTMLLVASVFWNRLDNADVFPLLQSDPTSNYSKDVVKRYMDVVDETMVTAYDTYKSPGLPPGAICNPGIEAIDAVLEKFQSSYFYFYANINTGKTYFAVTNEEHEENIAMVEQQYAEERAAGN